MRNYGVLMGVLLFAAPAFSQTPAPAKLPLLSSPIVRKGELRWFSLSETPADIRKALGAPHISADFSEDFVSWSYQIDVSDTHEFSHQLLFRKSTGRLISVARNYEEAQHVDAFFPETQTRTFYWPDAAHAQYRVRARRLSDGRILLAMGVSKPGETTTELLLIRESELPHFHAWLVPQLEDWKPENRKPSSP